MVIYRAMTRDEREAAYAQVFNTAGAALARGDVAEWAMASEIGTEPGDLVGKSVVAGTADSTHVAGVVRGLGIDNSANIPDNQFGVIQVGGFCDFLTITSTDVTAGQLLKAAANADAAAATVGTDGELAFAVALEAQTGLTLTACMLRGLI